MGSVDLVGYEVPLANEHFLYTESIAVSAHEKVILVKGIVTKKIVFNKRPTPNLDRGE